MEIITINFNDLEINPDQPRRHFSERSLEEITDSIKEHGLINPIIVAPINDRGKYKIVAGERRYRACKKLRFENLEAIVTNGNPDEIALIDNIQRENLHPIEEAEAYARMIERRNCTHDDIARMVSKDRTTVTKMLKLTKLDQRIKDESMSAHPHVRKSVLLEIVQLDAAEQYRYWNRVKGRAVTVREARAQNAKKEKPRLAAVVRAGRAFLRKLAEVSEQDVADASEKYIQLLQIYNEVTAEMSRIQEDG